MWNYRSGFRATPSDQNQRFWVRRTGAVVVSVTRRSGTSLLRNFSVFSADSTVWQQFVSEVRVTTWRLLGSSQSEACVAAPACVIWTNERWVWMAARPPLRADLGSAFSGLWCVGTALLPDRPPASCSHFLSLLTTPTTLTLTLSDRRRHQCHLSARRRVAGGSC